MNRPAVLLALLSAEICLGQWVQRDQRPEKDAQTGVLIRFEDTAAPDFIAAGPGQVKGKATFVPGRFGQAAVLPEGGIECPTAGNLDLQHGTVEFWFKAPDDDWFMKNHTFLGHEAGWCKPGEIRVWWWADGQALRFDHHSLDNGYNAFIATGMLPDTRWHHVAAVWDCDKGIRLYVDGRLANTRAGRWPSWAGTLKATFTLGEDLGGAAIDELRISKAALLAPGTHPVSVTVGPGTSRVRDGRTVLPISVTFTNLTGASQSVTAKLRVRSYFQEFLKEAEFKETLGPKASVVRTIEVPADDAGPYVKVGVHLELKSDQFKPVDREFLCFAEVRTGPRLRLDLNGVWQQAPGDPMAMTKVPEKYWDEHVLPQRDAHWPGHAMWFRKTFNLPAEAKGKVIELNLSGVRFRANVFLNGKPLGQFDTDQMPLAVDLTSAAEAGKANELVIGVTDWISCTAPELMKDFVTADVNMSSTGGIAGTPIIRACSGTVTPAGIEDPIFVTVRNSLAVRNVFVTPSVRKQELAVKIKLENGGPAAEAAIGLTVVDEGKPVKTATPQMVKVAKGKTTEVAIVIPWTEARLWRPDDPHLYQLRAELTQGGKPVDRMDTRFGFREFWCDGPVFRLNGPAIRPRAQAGWPCDLPAISNVRELSTIDNWDGTLRILKDIKANANVNIFRYHTEPYPILMYDAADEVGLLVVSEGLMSSIPFKLKWADPRLWANLRAFYPQWVLREFNHPSVVIRSIENECGYYLPEGAVLGGPAVGRMVEGELKRIGRMVKKLDPSRPILYEGSGPIFDEVSDVTNNHYPSAEGQCNLYPGGLRWADRPIRCYYLKKWQWKRDRPLYIGEAMFACPNAPDFFATMFGNDAYIDDWFATGEVAYWKMGLEAARICGITAYSPWTMMWGCPRVIDESNLRVRAIRDGNVPIATFIHEYRENYFQKRQVSRTLSTLNDTYAPAAIRVRWQLWAGSKVVQEASDNFTLGPAETKVSKITLALPAVAARTEGRLIVETFAAGKLAHRAERAISIFPDRPEAAACPAGVRMVGADTPTPNKKEIADYVSQGGKLLVLAQTKAPAWLPVRVEMVEGEESALTILHPEVPGHPILKDLGATDLRFWREDEATVSQSYKKPQGITVRSIADGGPGLLQVGILEIPYGKGVILLVQFPIFETLHDQPAAGILLGNIFAYLSGYTPAAVKPIGLLAGASSGTANFMDAVGAGAFKIAERLDAIADLGAYGAILVDGDDNMTDLLVRHGTKFRSYVQQGGTVWLHGLSTAQMAKVAAILPGRVTVRPLRWLKAPVRLARTGLIAGLSNDEVYWAEHTNLLAPPAVRIAAYQVDASASKGVTALAEPAILATVPDGRGQWLIDEVTWDRESVHVVKARRIVTGILTNLGVQIVRPPETKEFNAGLGYHFIDIGALCNEGFRKGVWSRGGTEGLIGLPTGDRVFRSVIYRVIDPAKSKGRSCILMYSQNSPAGSRAVTIPIGRRAARVHLLVTSLWSKDLAFGTPLVRLKIRYADGVTADGAITFGRDVLDWCLPPAEHPRTAWIGAEHPRPGLYNFAWDNPSPEKPIRDLELVAANDAGFAVVLGVTTQDRLPPEVRSERWIPGMQERPDDKK